MVRRKWNGKALLGMFVATAVLTIGLMGCNDGDGDGGGDGDVVGDWRLLSADNGDGIQNKSDDEEMVLSFQSGGGLSALSFQKLGSVWVESSLEDEIVGEGATMSWRTSGGTLYIVMRQGYQSMEFPVTFTVSGNGATARFCEDGDCVELHFDKVNLADFKRSLGTVYKTDPAIYGDWTLQDEYEYLYLYSSGFYGGERYTNNEYSSSGIWYTNGSKLYLAVEECDYYDDVCTFLSPVELDYVVSGTGSNKQLKINNDIWTLDDDYYYSPAKLQQSKKPAKKGAFGQLSKFLEKRGIR